MSAREDFQTSETKRKLALECMRQANLYKLDEVTAKMHAEIAKAWSLLEEACELCPTNHRARFLLVSLCMNDENYRRAKEESEKIYESLSQKQLEEMNDPLLYRSLIHACKMLGDFDAATTYATAATEVLVGDPQSHMMLGELLELKGDHAGAERCCKTALETDASCKGTFKLSLRNVVFTLCCRALAQLRLSNFSDAEDSARQAAERDPHATLPLIRLSEVYHLQGRLAEAIDAAQHASALDPRDYTANQRVAFLQRAAGDDAGLRPPSANPWSKGVRTSPRGSRIGSDVSRPQGSKQCDSCLPCCFGDRSVG